MQLDMTSHKAIQREILLVLFIACIFLSVILLQCQKEKWTVVASNATLSWITVHLNWTSYFSFTPPLDQMTEDVYTEDYVTIVPKYDLDYWLIMIDEKIKERSIEKSHLNESLSLSELKTMRELLLSDVDTLNEFPSKYGSNLQIDIDELKCGACKLGVTLIQTLLKQNSSKAEIESKLSSFCVMFHIQDKRVCNGVVKSFQVEFLYVFAELALSPNEVCGFLLGDSCSTLYNPWDEWNVLLPSIPKPPVKPIPQPKKEAHKLRVLQLSDTHVDFEYKPGSNSNCDEPICCHKDNGPVVDPSDAAGKFGMYGNCDVPTWTYEDMLHHISKTQKVDYIIWTGDSPDHKIWTQTRGTQLKAEKYMQDTLHKYFPSTPVYSVLGNHESVPVNSFPPPFIKGEYSISWLYNQLAKDWTTWLPNSTYKTIQKGAFYTTLIYPGMRIVSINTNFCNNQNWWLLLNTTDPAHELEWLIDILQKAETTGEKVHILGHIPPGAGDCTQYWSWNYHKIVNRYESTIRGQFFAHTHKDHFIIHYDNVTHPQRRATNVAYMGPSITTYGQVNPGYRIYEIDGFYNESTFAVLDHQTYFANLTEANLSGKLNWTLEYSAKKAYNMSALNPADWDKVYSDMKRNKSESLDLYIKYYRRSYSTADQCDQSCRKTLLCEIERSRSSDPTQCQDL